MMRIIYTILVFILILQVACCLDDNGIPPSLLRQMEHLESKYQSKVDTLFRQINANEEKHAQKLEELDKRISALEKRNEFLEEMNMDSKAEIAELKLKMEKMVDVQVGKDLSVTDRTKDRVTRGRRKTAVARGVTTGENVVFTAYMDHDLDNIGLHQNLVFNRIEINEGNAYNTVAGTFVAPITGVYFFSFFVGERSNNEIRACLNINNVAKLCATAEGTVPGQDLQGGNSGCFKLTKGDTVVITSEGTYHPHVEGDIKVTTFSGFLLYPVEDTVITGR